MLAISHRDASLGLLARHPLRSVLSRANSLQRTADVSSWRVNFIRLPIFRKWTLCACNQLRTSGKACWSLACGKAVAKVLSSTFAAQSFSSSKQSLKSGCKTRDTNASLMIAGLPGKGHLVGRVGFPHLFFFFFGNVHPLRVMAREVSG